MSLLVDALRRYAFSTPNKVALHDADGTLTYAELLAQVQALAAQLRDLSPRALGIFADNSREWAVMDLAAWLADTPIVPLPKFFSNTQLENVLRKAGIDIVVSDNFERLAQLSSLRDIEKIPLLNELRYAFVRDPAISVIPNGTWKITFTSGTTGDPKGVCLGREQLEIVAAQLCGSSNASDDDRHLCLLPLSMLLENIGGLYVPVLAGATICLPKPNQIGLSGSSGLQPKKFLEGINTWRPSTAIMVPQLLQALVALVRAGASLPNTLRYIAVGGAAVSPTLLSAAHAIGLPVYEGYGLSECASVVAVNRPHSNRIGSVGKPLPHIRVSFAADGEIRIHGMHWGGYLGERSQSTESDFIATGDIGYLDDAGFLFVTGRKKNIFISAFGRNIAPEWVERELVLHTAILQACVFGEARPYNCAVIVAAASASTQAIETAIAAANQLLPDYARVYAWILATEPFSAANEFATANGRLRRDCVFNAYAQRIDALYQTDKEATGAL